MVADQREGGREGGGKGGKKRWWLGREKGRERGGSAGRTEGCRSRCKGSYMYFQELMKVISYAHTELLQECRLVHTFHQIHTLSPACIARIMNEKIPCSYESNDMDYKLAAHVFDSNTVAMVRCCSIFMSVP